MPDIMRATSKLVPFRRGGLVFPNHDAVIVDPAALTPIQRVQLAGEAALTVEVSTDDGATWAPFVASDDDRAKAHLDA